MKAKEQILKDCPCGCDKETFYLGYLGGRSDLIREEITDAMNREQKNDDGPTINDGGFIGILISTLLTSNIDFCRTTVPESHQSPNLLDAIITPDFSEKVAKEIEGKTEEEKSAIVKQMIHDNPLISGFFARVDDKAEQKRLLDALSSFNQQISELEDARMEIMIKWAKGEI